QAIALQHAERGRSIAVDQRGMWIAKLRPRHDSALLVDAVEAVVRIDLARLDVGDAELRLVADLLARAGAPGQHDLVAQLGRAGGHALGGERNALRHAT